MRIPAKNWLPKPNPAQTKSQKKCQKNGKSDQTEDENSMDKKSVQKKKARPCPEGNSALQRTIHGNQIVDVCAWELRRYEAHQYPLRIPS